MNRPPDAVEYAWLPASAACAAVVLTVLLPSRSAAMGGVAGPLPLTGSIAISTDDRHAYSLIETDETGWREAQFPGVWPAPPERGGFQALWGRFRFRVPDGLPSEGLGIRLGIVYRNDTAFLNGERIGATGEIGWGKPLLDPTVRVYPIPDGLLEANGENVLALRV